eukprot:scaffold17989_cov36-Cyclotella_meneghiniana.AAC.1
MTRPPLSTTHFLVEAPGGCGPGRNGQEGQTGAQRGGTGRTGPNKAEQGRTKAEHIGSRRNKKGILYLGEHFGKRFVLCLMGGTRQNKAEQRRNKAEQNQTWQNRRNKAKRRRNCSALIVPKVARILQVDRPSGGGAIMAAAQHPFF